jgi:hypothetical protein
MVIRLVVAASVLAGLTPASFAADCPPPDRAPQLQIVINDGKVAYDFTRTHEQMTDVPRELGVTPPNHGREPQGLTYSRLTLAVGGQVRYRESSLDSRCIYPDRIVVTVTSEQRVFVDMRYPEGSCEREAILDHENEHVRINRAAARARESTLRRAVEALLAAHPYYLALSSRPLQEAYLAPIQDRLKPILKTITADANKRHTALDSPASYAATRARCHQW